MSDSTNQQLAGQQAPDKLGVDHRAAGPLNIPVRVLLFDDQALVREVIAAGLRTRREPWAPFCTVVADVGTWDEMLGAANRLQPDVVLVDLLADPRVFQTPSWMARVGCTARVILLDECPTDLHVRQVLKSDIAGYVTKQQSLRDFERAIRDVVEGHRVFPREIAERLVLTAHGSQLPADSPDDPLESLTPRELEVLRLVARGLSTKQCAKELGISANTADNHKARLMRKLRLHKTADLTRLAIHTGLLLPGTNHN